MTSSNPIVQTPPLSRKVKAGIVALYMLAAAIFMVIYITISTLNGNPRAKYIDLVYQTAHKPYVYRIIVPLTIRGISKLVPDNMERNLNTYIASHNELKKPLKRLKWEPSAFHLYATGILVMYVFLAGFLVALRMLFSSLFVSSKWFTSLVPILALFFLLPWVNVTYLYDFSTLFFFSLGLTFLARANWTWFLILFGIGCLNKETTILLTVLFVVYYGFHQRLERKQFWLLLAGQLAIFTAVKIILELVFRDNPGGLFELHVLDHNLPLLWKWFRTYSPTTYFLILLLSLILVYDWIKQPIFLRDGLVILFMLVLMTFLMGWLNEWRDYLEAFPIVYLLFIHNIAKFMKIDIQVKSIFQSVTKAKI